MRDYTGVGWSGMPSPDRPDFLPRLRSMIGTIDYYLHDLNRGMARIQNGEIPDGSGTPLPGSGVVIPNEVGSVLFVGPGPVLDTDGSAFYYDEANNLLGLGTNAPAATLDMRTGATVTSGVPVAPSAAGAGPWLTNPGSSATLYTAIDDATPDDTDYIEQVGGQPIGGVCSIDLSGSLVGQTSVVLKIRAKAIVMSGIGTARMKYQLSGNVGNLTEVTIPSMETHLGFELLVDRTLTPAEIATLGTSLATITFRGEEDVGFTGSNGAYRLAVSWVQVELATTTPVDLTHWSVLSTLGSKVDYTGKFGVGTGSDALSRLLTVKSDATGRAVLAVQGFASQSEVLTEWINSAGTRLSSVTSDGYFSTRQLLLNGATSGTLTHIPATTTTSHSLTWPSAQGAADSVLSNNGSGALSWATISSLGGAFDDSVFRIIGSATATKKLAFEVDGLSVGTRTLTPQDASYIIAGTNIANTFTTTQTITPATDVAALYLSIGNLATADSITVNDGANDILTLNGTILNVIDFTMNAGTIGGGSSAAFTSALLTGARNIGIPDVSGTMVTRVAGASIAAGRIAFFNGNNATGQLNTDSDLTFATDTLTVTKIAATTFTGNITLSTKNIVTDTTTGTQIATAGGAAGQKLGFFGTGPIVQPLLATGAGATVDNVITALQNLGLVRQT